MTGFNAIRGSQENNGESTQTKNATPSEKDIGVLTDKYLEDLIGGCNGRACGGLNTQMGRFPEIPFLVICLGCGLLYHEETLRASIQAAKKMRRII